MGRIDRRLEQARNTSQAKEEQRVKSAIKNCIKSLQGSKERIKDYLNSQVVLIQDKAKREEEKQKRVVQNYKSHILVASKTISEDFSKTTTKL